MTATQEFENNGHSPLPTLPHVFSGLISSIFFSQCSFDTTFNGCFTELVLLKQCHEENKILQEYSDQKIKHNTYLGGGLSHHTNELY